MARRPDGEMVDVQLDEDVTSASGRPVGRDRRGRRAGDQPAGEPSDAQLPPSPRRWTRAATVVAVVVAAVVTGTVVEDLRDRAEQRRWADVLGVVQPLPPGEPPQELWRRPASLLGELVAVGRGTLVLVDDDRTALRGLDADTAEQAWTLELTVDGAAAALFRCGAGLSRLGFPGLPVITCAVGPAAAPSPSVLLTVDTATGAELGRVALPVAEQVDVHPVEDDVVLVLDGQDGPAAERLDPVTGEVRWTRALTAPPAGDDAEQGTRMLVTGDVLQLTGRVDGALDVRTGEPLAWWPDASPVGWTSAAAVGDDGVAVWTDGVERSEGRVHALDGTVRLELPGPLLTPYPDDGSASDVVLVGTTAADDAVRALHAVTGEERWRLPDACRSGSAIRLAGRLVCADPDRTGSTTLRQIDLMTGEEVWRATVPDVDVPRLLTDGGVVVVTGGTAYPEDPAALFRTYRWDDGTPAWTGTLPVGDGALIVLDRRLYAIERDDVVRLG